MPRQVDRSENAVSQLQAVTEENIWKLSSAVHTSKDNKTVK